MLGFWIMLIGFLSMMGASLEYSGSDVWHLHDTVMVVVGIPMFILGLIILLKSEPLNETTRL